MRPSNRWYPLSLPEEAAWLRNFASNLANVAAKLGISPADVAAIQADSEAVTWLAANEREIESFRAASREYRRLVLQGTPGRSPSYPAVPSSPPPAGITPGIYDRINSMVARIRAAPGCTPEVAALLNIIPAKTASEHLGEAKPDPSLQALPGNRVLVTFVRGSFSGVEVHVRVDKSQEWTNAGRFVRSPAELRIDAAAGDLPRSVQVRARYLRGNDAVGQYSDIDVISTIP